MLRFNVCSANLCPFDSQVEDRIWYPDEEVCKKGGITEDYPWIKIQRKISRKCRDPNKYFTVKMMRNVSRVTKKITGLNPDINYKRQLTNWLKGHKRRVYTEEERRIFAKRLRKNISN